MLHKLSKGLLSRYSCDSARFAESEPCSYCTDSLHQLSKDFLSRCSGISFHQLSKDLLSRCSRTSFHQISKDLLSRYSRISFHQLSKDLLSRSYYDLADSAHNMYTTGGLSSRVTEPLPPQAQQGFAEPTPDLMYNHRTQYR